MTGRLVLDYDADDRRESARIAAIVRRDDDDLRRVLSELREALIRVINHDTDLIGDAALDYAQAKGLLNYIDGWLDGVPLSLEE